VETPPPLFGEPSNAERFDALLRWLRAGGVSLSVWSNQSALLRVAPPLLRVAFPTTFTCSQAHQRSSHPRIQSGLQAYFPDCTRVEPQIRPRREGFETWEEIEAAAREARREALRERFEQDPNIKNVIELLGGELKQVYLDDENENTR